MNGSIALAKLGNTIHLLVQRPYLFPRFSLFRRRLVPSLASDSIRFSVTYILAAAVEYNVMAFLIGRMVGPEAVGVYNVMITIHFSLTGVVGMFTRPSWPALMDAFERRDVPWIVRTANILRFGGLGFAFLGGAGMVLLGPIVLPLWAGADLYDAVGEGFTMNRLALLAFSAYFAAHLWRHIGQTLALGVGRINAVVATVIAEAALVLAVGSYALVHTGDIAVIYFAMAAAIAGVSGWIFPLIFRRGLRLEEKGEQTEARSEQPVTHPA